MRIRNLFGMKQRVLSAALASTLALAAIAPAGFAQDNSTMLLRTLPIEISAYPEAADLDMKLQGADSTYQAITTTAPMLVRMEAIRRAYHNFGQNMAERDKLLKVLKDRYMQEPNNAEKFFDYGYAQLVMEGNKNGLFFLRKANDKIQSPYTNLAYGMAQIDIDRLIENAPVEELTTRKMDVVYKLKDALTLNRTDRLPGIWPTYVRILEGIKDYPAYTSFINEDTSMIYVPYGTTSLSRDSGGNQFMAYDSTTSAIGADEPNLSSAPSGPSPDIEQTCTLSNENINWGHLAFAKSVDLDNNGTTETLNFFSPNGKDPYKVRVMNANKQVIGEFVSHKGPYITEDLEGDGQFELVVRQFDKDPYHPLYVYRWNGKCYAKDKTVASYFN